MTKFASNLPTFPTSLIHIYEVSSEESLPGLIFFYKNANDYSDK